MTTHISDKGAYVEHKTIDAEQGVISYCKIDVSETTWQVSMWNTQPAFRHKGIGRKAFAELISHIEAAYGKPEHIQYTWNGQNHYVKDWLTEHFDAQCTCPIEVLKYSNDDVWKSHIYELNVDAVLEYAHSN